MKQTQIFIPTLKEVPSEAQIPSHQLMLRSGLVRGLASGVFSFLPLGYKVIKKITELLREEMDAIGGQEFLLPALNPIEIWEQTGRVEAMGDVMFHIKNRPGLVLAPTHEEIITFHASKHIQSYKDLPQIWYQIQTKFRNEPRPKSGVLRGRQFTMKDAYSMDTTWEGLDISYQKHYDAYCKTFNRVGLKFFVVGASSGAMGGSKSQEFMVESNSGEDTCAVCYDCGYSANVEVASSGITPVGKIDNCPTIEEFATPNSKTIDDLVRDFNLDSNHCAKSVVYMYDSKPILILMRGNDELNETKLEGILKTNNFRAAEGHELADFTGANAGSIGPVNLKTNIRIIADNLLKGANGLVSGANKDGFHFKNIDIDRDCKIEEYYDLRTVVSGEPCPNCGKELKVVKAIELGHIFKLGTKYSEALDAKFLDEDGQEKVIIMGSYGIGVERVMACYLEQNFDEKGIIWNKELTPYDIHILPLNMHRTPEVESAAFKLYDELTAAGFKVMIDDRNETAGVKFNDADLLGFPMQLIVGSKNLANNQVELKYRRSGERVYVPINELVEKIKNEYV